MLIAAKFQTSHTYQAFHRTVALLAEELHSHTLLLVADFNRD